MVLYIYSIYKRERKICTTQEDELESKAISYRGYTITVLLNRELYEE